MTSITTTSLPQFFAVLSRPRSHHHHYHRRHNHDNNHNHQLCYCHQQHRRHNHQRCHHRQEARPIGPEGGVVASPLLPEVNFVVMVITIIMMNMILVIVIFILIIVIIILFWSSWSLPRIKPPLRLNVSSHRELWQNRSLLDFQFAPYPKISPTTFSHRSFEKWIRDVRRMVWKQKDPNCFRLGLPPQYVQWSPGGGSSTGSRSDRWTTIKEPSNSP